MKKTISISFFLLLFFSQSGYYFFYIYQQYQIKEAVTHELLSKLPESSLEIIDANAHKNDIEWEEEGKEFYLHGQMYDVAYIKTINGKNLIYCLNDSEEESLLKRLAKAVDTGNEQNSSNKNGHHIIKFQVPDFLIPDHCNLTTGKSASLKYIDRPVALITSVTEIPTPPPDITFKNKTCFL